MADRRVRCRGSERPWSQVPWFFSENVLSQDPKFFDFCKSRGGPCVRPKTKESGTLGHECQLL